MFNLTRREFLKATSLGLGVPQLVLADGAPRETLYNGIQLASPWPPDNREFSAVLDTPPYIADPPAVIPIDVGRQLFVDDFLIEESTLARTYHEAEYYPQNPVLRPTTAWERKDEMAERTKTRSSPTAMVFSDGVFYDPADRAFKLWYMGGYNQNTCLALSNDGITWERPIFDVIKGTNITLEMLRDSTTVWLDLDERNPALRYKLSLFNGSEGGLLLFSSPDGIHWKRITRSSPCGDRTTMFYNPFRNVWVYGLRTDALGGKFRHRRYYETRDFANVHWSDNDPVAWISSDTLDPQRPDLKVTPELYNLDCVAYESLVLGLFTIWYGEWNDREKPNSLCVGFSRDGFHWSRPSRRPFIPVSETVGSWNWANVQSAGGCCLIVGDELYFYVSGRQGVPGSNTPGRCSTGLARLRRDGFASLTDRHDPRRPVRAVSGGARSVTTRPVRFTGGFLFVNAEVQPGGQIVVDVLDREGRVIAPYSGARVSASGTRIPVSFGDRRMLAELAGLDVRFRFSITQGRLYAFWVSPSARGQSHGYVAAGGPGYARTTDI